MPASSTCSGRYSIIGELCAFLRTHSGLTDDVLGF
jgi:hypothetical protein